MRSPCRNAPLVRFEDQAVWIHDVLAQLTPDGPHIVGYSFGGATATVYARESPEDVRSLAVPEPVFTFSYPLERSFANAPPVVEGRNGASQNACLCGNSE